jgi:hypothetical protein
MEEEHVERQEILEGRSPRVDDRVPENGTKMK